MTSARPAIDPTSRRRYDIQGLRAVAVLAVVIYHAGVPFLPGGYVGVDAFFVISGFLITSHLLSGLRRDGRVRFASFYAKRVRRILPASFVVLAASVVGALIFYPPLLVREVWQGAVATAFYVPNVLFAAQGTNYLAETTPSLFQHYWSLGIEEQFYLVWPLLLALGFAWFKRPKALLAIVAGLVLISFVACVFLTFRQQPFAFFLLPTRAWELGVGGLAAFVLTYRPRVLDGVAAAVVGWVGVIGIVACAVFFTSDTPFPGYWAALPVLATVAVIIAGDSRAAGSPLGVLSTRPMLFLGEISYSLYLVHWPIREITQAAVGFENPLPVWGTVLLAVVSVPVAWLTWRFVEQPGREGSWLAKARPRRSLLAAAAASVAVAVIATGTYAYSNTRPLNNGQDAAATVVSAPPVFTGYVPENLRPGLRSVADDQPVIYADGCHLDFSDTKPADCVYGDANAPRIVLFGDSHAAQWFPALLAYAESNGYAVENQTKSSCPSIGAQVLRNEVPYVECSQWRDAVIDKINAEAPAMVVLSNYGIATLAGDPDDYAGAWQAALSTTLERINAPEVVIADTPNLQHTPSVCLSANLDNADECGQPRSVALGSPTRAAEQDAATAAGARYLDLSDVMCTTDRCDPVIGDTLAYRDAHHLTATFSGELAPVLSKRLGAL